MMKIIMKTLKKCIDWYVNAFGNAYRGESYRFYRLY